MMVCASNTRSHSEDVFCGAKKTTYYILCCQAGESISEDTITKKEIRAWCQKHFPGMAKIAEEELFAGHSLSTTKGRFFLKTRISIEVSNVSQ